MVFTEGMTETRNANKKISPRRALGFSTPDEACTVPPERPRLTTRERRERRAERLRGWADGQEAKGSARLAQARQAADVIPFGQPILVGHYSEGRDRRYRDRIVTNTGKGFEALAKAESMRSRAANIEAAAARAIYSDDDDAIERLEERIATLEAERDRIKRYNASCRKGAPDRSILTEQEASSLDSTMRVAPYMCKGGQFPAYHLSNLSGNIKRQRDRLAQLRRQVSW